MSENRYFDKFPIINYGGSNVVDITKRTTMIEAVSNNPYIFYPYELTTYERADQFSDRYFDDSYKSWIIYISNKIVDPYYEWYLRTDEFNDFLSKKYGSVDFALNKIKYYRNDWYNSKDILINRYDSLPASLKNYWEPVYGINNKITSYTRKQKDYTVNTNKIISYTVNNTSFMKNEIVTINFDLSNKGRGQFIQSSNNIIYLQHMSGTFLPNNSVSISGSSYLYGEESKIETSFTAANLISKNISDEEEIYWAPVTYADFENEKNEFNKTIRVLDKRLSHTVANNLKDLLKV
jgi:hypothetical protein